MKAHLHVSFACTTFGERFRTLRLALGSKQIGMTMSGLRCTDAAISHWERGTRLPRPRTMSGVLRAFSQLGATPVDIDDLREAWSNERDRRAQAERRRREASGEWPAVAKRAARG